MQSFLQTALVKCEITVDDCETFLYCMQKPLNFEHFKQLVLPHSRDFVDILEQRHEVSTKEKSQEMYKSEESFGRVIAARAEERLRDVEATRDELARTAIKSEE